MRNPRRLADLAILLPVGAVVLFVPPYVGLLDGAATLFGVPALHLYIFGAWAIGIVLTALVARRLNRLEHDPPSAPTQADAPRVAAEDDRRSGDDGI